MERGGRVEIWQAAGSLAFSNYRPVEADETQRTAEHHRRHQDEEDGDREARRWVNWDLISGVVGTDDGTANGVTTDTLDQSQKTWKKST